MYIYIYVLISLFLYFATLLRFCEQFYIQQAENRRRPISGYVYYHLYISLGYMVEICRT
jgi:hypothetical protein